MIGNTSALRGSRRLSVRETCRKWRETGEQRSPCWLKATTQADAMTTLWGTRMVCVYSLSNSVDFVSTTTHLLHLCNAYISEY